MKCPWVLISLYLWASWLPSFALGADDLDDVLNHIIYAQATFIPQWHPAFPALYSGDLSLNPKPELDASFSSSLSAGKQFWDGGDIYATSEVFGGQGFSDLSGLADFPNDDIARAAEGVLGYNQAEVYFRQVLGLGGDREDGPDSITPKWDISRLSLTVGKFSVSDFFDKNAYSNDPRSQFMNQGLVNNSAWDYAANTDGSTWGIMAELNQKDWTLRLCSAMVTDVAIGENYDGNIAQARGDNAELEWRYTSGGKIRLLAYVNHAHMGSYQDALDLSPLSPDITQTREYREKVGFGLNWEQSLNSNLGLFARLGWNDGQTESWMQAPVDETLSLGGILTGTGWGRQYDQLGLGFVVSGLSTVHQAYLAAGGDDFSIGDGGLNYAPETVAELYYLYNLNNLINIPTTSQFGFTLDFQYVANPAFNQDRGPVFITSARVHMEYL